MRMKWPSARRGSSASHSSGFNREVRKGSQQRKTRFVLLAYDQKSAPDCLARCVLHSLRASLQFTSSEAIIDAQTQRLAIR